MKHITLNLNLILEQDGFQKAKKQSAHKYYKKSQKQCREKHQSISNLALMIQSYVERYYNLLFFQLQTGLSEEQCIKRALYHNDIHVREPFSFRLFSDIKDYPQCRKDFLHNIEKLLEFHFAQCSYKDKQYPSHLKGSKYQKHACYKFCNTYPYKDNNTEKYNKQGF